MSDLLFLAADTVPYWTRVAVALLVLCLVGLVVYAAQRQPWD